jgi:hypothetical protein
VFSGLKHGNLTSVSRGPPFAWEILRNSFVVACEMP